MKLDFHIQEVNSPEGLLKERSNNKKFRELKVKLGGPVYPRFLFSPQIHNVINFPRATTKPGMVPTSAEFSSCLHRVQPKNERCKRNRCHILHLFSHTSRQGDIKHVNKPEWQLQILSC